MTSLKGYQYYLRSFLEGEVISRLPFLQVVETTKISTGSTQVLFSHEVPGLSFEDHQKVLEEVKRYMNLQNNSEVFVPIEKGFVKDDNRKEEISSRSYFLVSTLDRIVSLKKYVSDSQDSDISPKKIATWMFQLAKGLEALHQNQLIHKNITSESLIIHEGKLRISMPGFGFDHLFDHLEDLEDTIAPEVYENDEYVQKSDIFSAGEVFKRILVSLQTDDSEDEDFEQLQKIVNDCCSEETEQRLSSSDLIQRLKSTFEFLEDEEDVEYHEEVGEEDEDLEELSVKTEEDEQMEEPETKRKSLIRKPKSTTNLKIETSRRKMKKTLQNTIRFDDDSEMKIFDSQVKSKICFFGGYGSGKSSIIQKCSMKQPSDSEIVDYHIITTDLMNLHVWDTTGNEKFGPNAIPSVYFRSVDVGVLTFDLTSQESFEEACTIWYEDFMNNKSYDDIGTRILLFLVGNKSDCSEQERKVSRRVAKRFCDQKGLFYLETSAETGENIDRLFLEISKLLYFRKKLSEKITREKKKRKEQEQRQRRRRRSKRRKEEGDQYIRGVRLMEQNQKLVSENIEKLLTRGEQLEELVDRAEDLHHHSALYMKSATQTQARRAPCSYSWPNWLSFSFSSDVIAKRQTEPKSAPAKLTTTKPTKDVIIIDQKIPKRISMFEEGTRKKEMYKTRKLLGSGGQATTYVVENESNKKLYAMKQFHRIISEAEVEMEVFAMKTIPGHPNIVKFYDYFEYKNHFGEIHRCIIMEYCEKGDLGHRIRSMKKRKKKLDIEQYITFCEDILNGLTKVHSENFVHHDLKPSNIFVAKDMSLRLGDFGFAYKKDHSYHKGVVKGGSKEYMSPQHFSEKLFGELYLDIYSIGLVFLELLLKKGESLGLWPNYDFDTNFTIVKERMDHCGVVGLSDWVGMLRKCLDDDVQKRPESKQLLEFMRGIRKNVVVEKKEKENF